MTAICVSVRRAVVRRLFCSVPACLFAFAGGSAWSAGCPRPIDGQASVAWTLRVTNDMFARQDQNLSSGVQLKRTERVDPPPPGPCDRGESGWLWRQLARPGPTQVDDASRVMGLGQVIFTPGDPTRRDLILDDRPYAAALTVNLGYVKREARRQWSTGLWLGWVGPAALGRQTQDAVHELLSSERFLGWENQLRNEPLVMLLHERAWRTETRRLGPLESNQLAHVGGTLGNLFTRAHLRYEWRVGQALAGDFGSDPLQVLGDNAVVDRNQGSQRWSWHVFASLGSHLALHDITLDGNTFRDSHSVDRRLLVASGALGFSVTRGGWSFAFSRGWQTSEFDGQTKRPSLGSFTLTRELD